MGTTPTDGESAVERSQATPARRPIPQTRQAKQTFSALVDASIAEFSEQGYVAARVESITQRAQVAYGTFYSYFGSKVDVVGYIADRVYADLYAPVNRAPQPDLPVAERVFGNVLQFLLAYARNRDAITVVENAAGSAPGVAARVLELQTAHATKYAEKLEWPGYHPIANRQLIAETCTNLGYSVARTWARSSKSGVEDLIPAARVITIMTMAAVDPDSLQIPPEIVDHIANELHGAPESELTRV